MQRLSHSRPLRIAASLICLALLASPSASQQQGGPIARYSMDAGTISGMAAMAAGGRGGMGTAMSMMMGGGGNQPIHELMLRLGSTRTPAGTPQADHFLPPATGLGPSVPLITPKVTPTDDQPAMPGERPKGRLLIFWGCGAQAAPGQPVVIDFAKVAKGQMPPGLYMANATIPSEWQVRANNSKTYGEWPNGQTRKVVPANASLIGDHRIAGNYSPDIKFALTQDFMPAITGRSRAGVGGATELSWNAVAKATGYYAWVFGAKDNGDMVWWASSASQAFGGPMWDWMSPAAVQSLIGKKIVMPPTQTSCTVPAQVGQTAGEFLMGSLYAYGPEANFAYPPRPADPKVAWKPDWIARVRYRSNTMWMLGQPDMGDMSADGQDENDDRSPPPSKKKCKGGLGGMLGSMAGVGGC